MIRVLASVLLGVMVSALPVAANVSAAEIASKYYPNPQVFDNTYGTILSPSEIVALYPMSAEDEAKLIQVVPQCPVNVDGVWYKAEEITLFNGHQLHFTTDKKGGLYAFTDARAMEIFLEAEYGDIFNTSTDKAMQMLRLDRSELFADWLYSGNLMLLDPYAQISNLATLGWDNQISSAQICSSAPVTLWEYSGFQGSSFTMLADSSHAALTFEGWNDRASAIS
ncbi:MAG: hypothetical protein LLF82_001326 [Dehalococcoides mccartyi]|uniref:Lipoprotein n=2 Tax=Dehalococcoides mccartyi TaxID=61435 RepID=A0A0V8M2S3_9CHLR|nr:hypothetical protein [Dehalococcoides mccartyi]AAW39522.1 hypothetical protein DET1234 [Dehalococcoides mccartyi 195]AII59792.1 hypothetical protein X793_05650 [Dehalococcoides mccartyi CG4]AQU03475.1 hypothetical protein B1773_05515 [Dehalococcoides mccartyi]AQU04774.1 hypothetical protein B1774_05165 [Dehalococcoides mccartyi]KSV18103.1 hypothetical protein DA01_05540 [Dehalococcoides mccartyi]